MRFSVLDRCLKLLLVLPSFVPGAGVQALALVPLQQWRHDGRGYRRPFVGTTVPLETINDWHRGPGRGLRHPRIDMTLVAAQEEGAFKSVGVSSSLPAVSRQLKVIVAGGGIGGLCAALVLQKQGCDVQVFEKTRSYRPFGGPIQIASNALESLLRIDSEVYQQIMAKATMIGDRKNGLKDGVSNEWFATFDLYSPAKARNQDASVVIDRPILQDILLSRVGHRVHTGAEVVSYEKDSDGVTGILSNGTRYEADLLVGADGLWSKVRAILDPNPADPVWSGYTCFAAIANCQPDDIDTVGYKVYLGSRKYFVSVDVGGGRVQWYAFLNIPPNSLSLEKGQELNWLRENHFGGWSAEVQQLLDSTPQLDVEQRDLYDRAPELSWSSGRVCLLGDAAHPMMPNLGQGGGMAIEDALVLGQEIRRIGDFDAVPLALTRYNRNRALRAAAVQGMSRLSSAILFQYNHPTTIKSLFPLSVQNVGPRSLITRACQGFLQKVAFPLQFEFLFSFPGKMLDPQVFAQAAPGDFTGLGKGGEDCKGPMRAGVAESELSSGMSLRAWFARYW